MTPVARRWVTGVAGWFLGVIAALATPAGPAQAHAVLLSSTPVQGSVVGGPRTEVVLTFSEAVQPVRGRIVVLAPDGKRINDGEPTASGPSVTIRLRVADDPLGTYLVSYRVISADGHPVTGAFTYSAGAPSTPPSAPDDGAGVDPVVEVAVPVAKYVGYAGVLLLVGALLFLVRLWPHRLSRRGPARLAWTGLGLVAASTLAAVWLQAPYTTGATLFDVSAGDLREVLGSRFGLAHLLRLGVLVAVAVLAVPLLRGDRGAVRLVSLGALAVLGLGTWPLSGHPSASPVPMVTAVTDTVHIAAMAVWLGGLVMLVGFLLHRADETELGGILPVWSRWAALAVCWLALSGIVQAVVEVASVKALLTTDYGRLVLVKAALLVAVLVAAAYSRRMVQRIAAGPPPAPSAVPGDPPAQSGAPSAVPGDPPAPGDLPAARPAPGTPPRRLRRSVLAEVALTAVALGISAALVQTTPARTAAAEVEQVVPDSFATTLKTSIFTVQFDIYPVQLGANNTLHIYVYRPDGKPQPVVEWRVTAALPASGIEPIDTPVLAIQDNHAAGSINFLQPGDWRLRFTLRISEIDQASVETTVPVKA